MEIKISPLQPPLKMHFPLKLECCQQKKTPQVGQIEAIGRAMAEDAESRHAGIGWLSGLDLASVSGVIRRTSRQ